MRKAKVNVSCRTCEEALFAQEPQSRIDEPVILVDHRRMLTGKELSSLHAPRGISLRGHLVKEDAEDFWIGDGSSLWIVSKQDVLGQRGWTSSDPRFSEKQPIVLLVRDGAEIQEVRKYRIDINLAPLTVAREADLSAPNGLDDMRVKERTWATSVGIRQDGVVTMMRPATTCDVYGTGDPPLHGPDDCG